MDEQSGIRVALVGAGGGFGRTVLLALRRHPAQRPTVLCDLDTEAVRALLEDLGYDAPARVCSEVREVRHAVENGAIAIVADTALIDPHAYDVLVEATGSVPVSARTTLAAVEADRPVVLVSKETEATIGVALGRRAADRGVVIRAGAGDQPANLAALVSCARDLGLEIVAAGKSSEYDLVLDLDDATVSLQEATAAAPDLVEHWHLGEDVAAGVEARRAATSTLKLRAAADYCELTVAANLTGLGIDTPELHYPILRTTELADVLRPRQEGGLLGTAGVVEVFTSLRRPDEASFAGGEFVVVRVHDREVAELLAAKGHVVSGRRDLICIGLPFHLMGLEIPRTIAEAHARVPRPATTGPLVSMLARTTEPLPAGHRFVVAGHHHEIAGTHPWLRTGATDGAAPYYALDGARLRHEVPAGHLVQLSDVDGVDPLVLELLAEQQPTP
ncbi:homoserine dehydrogenase [Pseudactinotalea suaedae]|uniref:homoserine dehydrogenase n=1 Tax=Pseudactinotalea suaedae TaxID=1524924 RepID=UPI0012E14849|nr:homoserine dehydrogenase [Pseudactinotalea suaedae]